VTLQNPTAAQNALGTGLDPGGSIPSSNMDNKYVQVGTSRSSTRRCCGQDLGQVASA